MIDTGWADELTLYIRNKCLECKNGAKMSFIVKNGKPKENGIEICNTCHGSGYIVHSINATFILKQTFDISESTLTEVEAVKNAYRG